MDLDKSRLADTNVSSLVFGYSKKNRDSNHLDKNQYVVLSDIRNQYVVPNLLTIV